MMPQSLTKDDFAFLLANHEPPCLSLYQPTHRRRPENLQDPIRYRNLLKVLEDSMRRQHSAEEVERLLAPFEELAHDAEFWNHTADGLAVLGSPDVFRVFMLQQPVGELAIAANSFHIKPLLRILQSAGRYQVLCLNRHAVRLFEGDSGILGEVELAARVPRSMTEALGEELTEPHQTVASYGGTALGSSMRHGHGSKSDELEIDDERFFRAVDRAILEHHSTPSSLPLILAAPGQHQTPFRTVSHNPFLMPKGIALDPHSLSIEQLRQRAWEIIEPEVHARLVRLAAQFEEAEAKGLGSDDLGVIAKAATQGRVASLLLEAERRLPGKIDPVTGRVRLHALENPEIDDLLDDLAELVLKKGGDVAVVQAVDMPSVTGAAAIFRF